MFDPRQLLPAGYDRGYKEPPPLPPLGGTSLALVTEVAKHDRPLVSLLA